jgi:tetratricopeptide (TPR) repeat protein
MPLLFDVVERSSNIDAGIDAIARWDDVAMRAEYRLAAAEAVAARWPDNAAAQQHAASAAFATGDYDAALTYADRALELDPADHKPVFLRASVLVARDDPDAAVAIIEPFADESASVEDRISAAIQYGRADRYSEALDVLNRILLEDPDNIEAIRASALIHVGSGNYESAAADFERLLGSNEYVHESLFYLGTLAEREGQLSQAVRYYAQVDDGEYATLAQRRLAGMLRERRGTDVAIEHLNGFVERHPRYGLELSLARAALLAEDERYDDALALYNEYIEIRPGTESVLLARANTVLQRGDLDGAIDQYRDIVDLYPDSATALNALGYTLADRTRKLREAERLIDRALEMEPDNPAIIDSKGWVLFKRGKLAEAREYLERAWELFRDPEVGAHLGETLWRLGDEEAARAVLEEAWRRFPDDEVLRDTLERLIESGPVTRS